MDAFAVPGDVVDALAVVGYRVVEAAGASAWLAEPVDSVTMSGALASSVEVQVLPVQADAETSRRADLLCGLRHPHLPQVHALLPLAPGRSALVVEHVPGMRLGRLRRVRAPLADGEAATVTIPVAQALGALHALGLAHGGVRGEAITVRPDGRPVLVDLRGAVLGGGAADDDLRRLLSAALAVLPGPDVELLVGDVGAPSLRSTLEALLVAPVLTGDLVVERCFQVVEPEPVRLPDLGSLAAAAVAGAARPGDVRRSAANRARRARDGRGARLRSRRVALVLGLGALAAPVTLAGAALLARATGEQVGSASPTTAASLPTPTDPGAAAEELTRTRARVLAAVDRAALAQVDAPGGPALAADTRLLDGLQARALEGLSVDVVARVRGAPSPSSAQVDVTTATSAYVRVGEDGARTPVAPAAARSVLLDLRRTPDGWRVWDVREP